MDAGWWGDLDVGGAVSFVAAQPDVDDDRIAAVGLSLGGEVALGAAAGDQRIRAVVAEGVGQRVAADKQWQSEEFGWRGRLQERVDWLTYALVALLTDADPPGTLRDAVADIAPRPVLLIAGGAAGSEATVARFIRSSPANAEVWVVPGAGHTGGLDTAPAEWETRVIAVLDDAIGG
jgi:uncharacterized protein